MRSPARPIDIIVTLSFFLGWSASPATSVLQVGKAQGDAPVAQHGREPRISSYERLPERCPASRIAMAARISSDRLWRARLGFLPKR